MIVDKKNKFITQRQIPKMALIKPSFEGASLILNAPGMDPLKIPLKKPKDGSIFQVTVWKFTGRAMDQGDTAANWVSKFLEKENCRLVRQLPNHPRLVEEEKKVAGEPNTVSFADAFPYLIISEASLSRLNDIVEDKPYGPLEMRRFRPNLVVAGVEPFEEAKWETIKIGKKTFFVVKSCSRCKLTTVLPDKGEFGNEEPLATIKAKRDGIFGENALAKFDTFGKILKLGEPITVVTLRPEKDNANTK